LLFEKFVDSKEYIGYTKSYRHEIKNLKEVTHLSKVTSIDPSPSSWALTSPNDE
jgi:hypothetical protein